jgi:hypothetical protein
VSYGDDEQTYGNAFEPTKLKRPEDKFSTSPDVMIIARLFIQSCFLFEGILIVNKHNLAFVCLDNDLTRSWVKQQMLRARFYENV